MYIQQVDYARAAYEAYCSVADEKTRDALPTWDELKVLAPQAIEGWQKAANAVVRETINWYREFLTEQQARMPQ